MNCEELNSVWTIKREYERELQHLEDLRSFAIPSTPPLDGMPHAPQPQSSKVETLATLIVEAEAHLWTLLAEWQSRIYRLSTALQRVAMKELPKRVLNFHYVDCQSFNTIAKRLNFSRRYILNLHDEGLRSLGLDVREMIQFRQRQSVHD